MAGSVTIAAGIDRRRAIMRYVKHYIKANRVSPSIEEITDAVELSSKSTTRHHIDLLVASGELVRSPGKYRTLRLPNPSKK